MKKLININPIKRVCFNCMDFNSENNTCTIRYLIHEDKSRTPVPRRPSQKGCEVFLYK